MNCPKCSGESFLADEELVQVLENTEPIKVIIKATYQCNGCSERFSRVIHDSLEARKKEVESMGLAVSDSGPVEGIKFF
ncbi:MAG: hypothetical protein ISS36_04740 [Candidatus Aenigmarchaeota archaeon]|nr:hypothetical protein [Candidatus Aenigmarchaeota archaeon]